MELRHLRYFVAVAEELSFVGAAKRLRLAQPALSKQIHDLEFEIGTPLFHRMARGVRLTLAGEAFFEEARQTIQSASRARDRARQAAQDDAANLRVAHGELFVYDAAIQRLLAAFRDAHPTVHIHLHSHSDAETERSLRDRRIDVGFAFVQLWPLEGLEAHRLFDTSATGILIPGRHPLATQAAIKLADLRGLRWLGAPPAGWPGMAKAMDAGLRSRGLLPQGGPERSRSSPLISVVAEDAWSLASEVVGAPYQGNSTPVVYRPMADPPIPAWLAMIWPPVASPLVQSLLSVALSLGLSADESIKSMAS
jgi:DNA-binding transcriptional LysR family regulator